MKPLLQHLALLLVLFGLTQAARSQTFTVLYNFGSQADDPWQPTEGHIVQGTDGNLYSTAPGGGQYQFGAAYKITPAGALTNLHNFHFGDGKGAYSGFTLSASGNFIGTTFEGGAFNNGTIYRMSPSGQVTTLYSFTGGNDGGLSTSPPIEASNHEFYGTTPWDGLQSSHCYNNGCGVIYKITANGTFTVLHNFKGTDGSDPSNLTEGTDGKFYGAAQFTDFLTTNYGEVFRAGSQPGEFRLLHKFGPKAGSYPLGGLVEGNDGYYYGTTSAGGTHSAGMIYRMSNTGMTTVLHNSYGFPNSDLLLASDGNLYGVTPYGGPKQFGTIFRITPGFVYTVLYVFDGTTASTPYSPLMQHTSGLIYGTTNTGGTGTLNGCGVGNCGVFFSLDVGAPSFVRLTSRAARSGDRVGILGQNFRQATEVNFNGVRADFQVVSDTYMTAIVPTGVVDGVVSVRVAGARLSSSKPFRLIP